MYINGWDTWPAYTQIKCPGPRSRRIILAFPKASVHVSSLESHYWLKGTTKDSSFRSPWNAYHCPQKPSKLLKMSFFPLYSCRIWSCLPMPYNFPKLRSHLEAPPHSKLKSFSSPRSSPVDLCLGPAPELSVHPRQTASRSNHMATTPVCMDDFWMGHY